MSSMPITTIGSIVKKSSVLGMGCWAIGGRDWGLQSDTASVKALKCAFDYGITHFDTAQAYGKGHSEELIGKALKTKRSEIFIASKVVYVPPEKVEKYICLSLRRLKTDYIDLFYIHWPRKNVNLASMMEKLVQARERGIIRGIGVSNFSVSQMQEVMKAGSIDAHQLCYNLLWRWPEREIIPFCKKHHISVVTYCTIAQGILSGRFIEKNNFSEGDHRKNIVFFEEDVWQNVFKGVEKFKKIAAIANKSLTTCAILWAMKQDGIASVLVGARTEEQVRGNVKSIQESIEENVFDRLTKESGCLMDWIPECGNIFRWYP
jgi:myo-inositol catabolism protein IolS